MGKICDVVCGLEVITEGKCVVVSVLPSLDVVLVVSDVLASPCPSVLVGSGAVRDLHAILERRIPLGQVEDMEPDPSPKRSVLHSKEEPLRAPTGIDVLLYQEVVLVFLLLGTNRIGQIATLESTLKKQLVRLPLLGRRGASVPCRFLVEGFKCREVEVVVLRVVPAVCLVQRPREELTKLTRG